MFDSSILSPKQIQFILEANSKINIAHGSVRSGKTVGSLCAFMNACYLCPDSQLWMIGKTAESIYDNAIRLLLEPRPKGESDPFIIYRPFCNWLAGKRELKFFDKTIGTLGAKDSGAVGIIQGKTFSKCYCDEMTLYPENVTEMIRSRLSNPHSQLFATMNPSHPNHIIKKWIDLGEKGDKSYYSLHFTLDDNPFVDESYKRMIKESSSGLFYKRNYLGLWCNAEGAVFESFDRDINVVKRAPAAAEYYIAGIDFGTTNAFACIVIGVSTGKYTQSDPLLWAEAEYYWDSKKMGRQKTNFEYAADVTKFLEPYGVTSVYVDPSAASFKVDLRRRGFHVVDAKNDVFDGICYMNSEMKRGAFFVSLHCPDLIREIESYVWDEKKAEKGEDEPLKKGDHAIDATRYALYTHKVAKYNPYADTARQKDYLQNRFNATSNRTFG